MNGKRQCKDTVKIYSRLESERKEGVPMNKFWEWGKITTVKAETGELIEEERVLRLDGTIASDSWWDDEITPAAFKAELNEGDGPITVWINSPGGDVFAGAQIYNMLKEYPGNVTVKIDALAASAATVIAMAGDRVLMSPVGMFMIHNPWTVAQGDSQELSQVIEVLEEIEQSLINAYALKTGLSRKEIAKLMDNETWMNANEALSKGFIDGILYSDSEESLTRNSVSAAYSFSPAKIACSVRDKVRAKITAQSQQESEPVNESEPDNEPAADSEETLAQPQGRSADECLRRLDLIKTYF